MIDYKFRRIEEIDKFSSRVVSLIANKKLDIALSQISKYVLQIIAIPEFTGKLIRSYELDNLLAKITETQVQSYKAKTKNKTKSRVIIIASSLPKVGGHISLIKDFLQFNNKITDIFLTKKISKIELNFFDNFLKDNKLSTRLIQMRNYSLFQGVSLLASISPSEIYLFTDANDSLGVCLGLLNSDINVNFIHHTDNYLSLGASINRLNHFDLSNISYNDCCHTHLSMNKYLPLTANFTQNDYYVPVDKLNNFFDTCTSGREEKFYFDDNIHDYAKVISSLLKLTKKKHYHIGYLSDKNINFIQKKLKENNVSSENFIHVPYVKSVSKFIHEKNIPIYLSSFPIPGAKVNIEIMGSGIPIFFYKSARNKYFYGAGLFYEDVISWESTNDLMSLLTTIDNEKLIYHSNLGRKFVNRYYNYDRKLMDYFIKNKDPKFIPPLVNFIDDHNVRDLIFTRNKYSYEIERVFKAYNNSIFAYNKLVNAHSKLVNDSKYFRKSNRLLVKEILSNIKNIFYKK
jgi:hypothetical protein